VTPKLYQEQRCLAFIIGRLSSMNSKGDMAAALKEINTEDCHGTLAGLIEGMRNNDSETVWEAAREHFGVERESGTQTLAEAVQSHWRALVDRREAAQRGIELITSFKEDPEGFRDRVLEYADQIRGIE
jgi:hypothetical protein